MDRLASLPSILWTYATREHIAAALERRSMLPSFAEARASANRMLAASRDAQAIFTLTLRANDQIDLIRFGARGGATVLASF